MRDAYPLRNKSISRVYIESIPFPDGNPGHTFFVVVWWRWGAAKERPEYFWQDDIGNLFKNRSAAEKFAKRFKVGSNENPEIYDKETARAIVDAGHFGIPEFEEDHLLPAYQTLFDFKISSVIALSTSRGTITTISIDRAKELRKAHGELWPAAANYEFCLQTFDPSHPAFIASECLFHFHITDEQYWVGYKLRDLQLILSQVEHELSQERARKRNAGKGGADHKKGRRLERIVDLVGRMEALFMENPMARAMQPEELADHAVRNVNTPLWSEGRGQVTNYLTEVRCGDHGEDLKSRYFALFPAQAPKPLS